MCFWSGRKEDRACKVLADCKTPEDLALLLKKIGFGALGKTISSAAGHDRNLTCALVANVLNALSTETFSTHSKLQTVALECYACTDTRTGICDHSKYSGSNSHSQQSISIANAAAVVSLRPPSQQLGDGNVYHHDDDLRHVVMTHDQQTSLGSNLP